jgi:alginate O-acetyltransferase complex protein AlgI
MLFVSQQFLGFFIAAFAVYWMLPWHRARMLWLLVASAFFYMTWNPWLITLVLFSASIDYFAALGLERLKNPTARRSLLAGSITINLGLLAYFKYANFFLSSAAHAGSWWAGTKLDPITLNLVLPLGISFYTFETISYVVDVYRRKVRAERDPLNYALFILFFPHLIAGPIVRPGDFLPQTRRTKRWSWPRMYLGLRLFLLGMFKKAVLADHLAAYVDPVFASPGSFGFAETWLAVLGYALQIYGDFSGYSDMAIGIAHAFGFKLHPNFNMPYLSADISEFWRRWHISLSSWLRDYLYIPLGGSRGGEFATYRNLLITMVLGGLWHGASWTFLAWGLMHGILLAAHRALSKAKLLDWVPRALGVVTTFLCVAIGWVFFRAQKFEDALTILQHLVIPSEFAPALGGLAVIAILCLAAMGIGHLAGAFGLDRNWDRPLPTMVAGVALGLAVVLVFLLLPETGKGFIYFVF